MVLQEKESEKIGTIGEFAVDEIWMEELRFRWPFSKKIRQQLLFSHFRKAILEVTGEEKPKTRLRRRKANKRLCRKKKPVCVLPDEEKPVSLVSNEKKSVCAVLGRKITTNNISREKRNRNL